MDINLRIQVKATGLRGNLIQVKQLSSTYIVRTRISDLTTKSMIP